METETKKEKCFGSETEMLLMSIESTIWEGERPLGTQQMIPLT